MNNLIKDEVCSLELSVKLKELAIKKDSIFYWVKHCNPKLDKWELKSTDSFNHIYHLESVSAFTCNELMNLLPSRIDTKNNQPYNNFNFILMRSFFVDKELKIHPSFILNYHCNSIIIDTNDDNPIFFLKLFKHNIFDKKFPNALAKTLIYLIEEKFINMDNMDNQT